MMTTLLTIVVVIIVLIILFKVFKLMLRLLVVAVFLFLAYITNPVLEQHQQAVAQKAIKNNSNVKMSSVEADDYWVFSLTRITTQERTRVIGAGAFTQVIIFGNLN